MTIALHNEIMHCTGPIYPRPCSGTVPNVPAATFADRQLPPPNAVEVST